jgi:hypothetical protein
MKTPIPLSLPAFRIAPLEPDLIQCLGIPLIVRQNTFVFNLVYIRPHWVTDLHQTNVYSIQVGGGAFGLR